MHFICLRLIDVPKCCLSSFKRSPIKAHPYWRLQETFFRSSYYLFLFPWRLITKDSAVSFLDSVDYFFLSLLTNVAATTRHLHDLALHSCPRCLTSRHFSRLTAGTWLVYTGHIRLSDRTAGSPLCQFQQPKVRDPRPKAEPHIGNGLGEASLRKSHWTKLNWNPDDQLNTILQQHLTQAAAQGLPSPSLAGEPLRLPCRTPDHLQHPAMTVGAHIYSITPPG